MMERCTSATVVTILQEKVGVPSNTQNIETATWDDLGIESLGLSETFASLELILGVAIPYEEALHTKNVRELVAFVNTQIEE